MDSRKSTIIRSNVVRFFVVALMPYLAYGSTSMHRNETVNVQKASIVEAVVIVTVYQRGKPVDLSTDGAEVKQLVAECEKQLSSADNILRLAVSTQLISGIKKNEVAVEIRYRQPRSFVLAKFNDRAIQVQSVLIPVTGDFAGSVTTMFLGYPEYASGPYRNSIGTANLVKIISNVNVAN